MITNLRPYHEYRESELPWLGEIPNHWKLLPNRGLVRKRKVLVGNRHNEYKLLSLTKQGVIVRDVSTGKGKFSADMGTSQVVRNGDLVFCLFDVPETPRTVGLSRYDGMITGAYTVFESLGIGNREYFELFYRAMDDRKLLSPLYSGLRNTIPPDRFLGTKTPQPPPEEQTAIVRYLDWACGRLDRAIRAKRKIIGSLHEQKRTIISDAVTRGIGPSVQLKHSGVDWIGEIPASWGVFRIKNVMRALDRRSSAGTEDLLSVRMHHGIVRFSEHFQRPPQARTLVNFKIVEPGQFVVNRMQAGNGLIFCSDLFGLVSPDYSVLDVVADVNKEFLGELMRSRLMRWKFRVESKGLGTGTSGFLRLYDDRLGSVHVALPPRREQDSIMLELKGKLSGLVDATGRVQREMDLLQEYRTRLIADVVTGKLDVREAAAKLPDAAVEPETALEQEPEELELEEELVEGE